MFSRSSVKRSSDPFVKKQIKFNQAWVPAGFNNSLAVKRNDAFLYDLLGSLSSFFTMHAEWQDAAHGITGEQAQSLRTALSSAGSAVSLANQARATHYRFYTQANLEQPEPMFAGDSPTPSFIISDLEPGQLYQVFVSAANEAGESPLSEWAEVTPIELAKAA